MDIDDLPVIDENEWPSKPQAPKEIEYHNSLIEFYTAFRDQMYAAKHVLHPSCALDASPAKVFDDVTFVDIEAVSSLEGAMELFRKHGLNAFKMDIKDYTPEQLHDLLILLNPAISTARAIHAVQQGGFVIANNYHGNASEMAAEPEQYELVGTIDYATKDKRAGDNRVILSTDLNDLFVPCEDFAELERRRPTTFKFIKEAYPHLLRTSGQEPGDTIEETYRLYHEMMMMSTELPQKRDADFCIFKKK